MKLGQFSRVPYEVKTKDIYSPKVRMRPALVPQMAAEFYVSQDIYTILPPNKKEEPEEKKSPAKTPERVAHDSDEETLSEAKDFRSRARESLLEQVNCLTPDFTYTFDLAPSASFFKFLCARSGLKQTIPKLKMWVPDTVVYNDTDRPFWIYSNLAGEVCRYEGFSENEVFIKLPKTTAPSEASVLLKKPYYDHKRKRLAGNTTALIPNEQLRDKVRMLQRGDGEKAVLQRYVQNHGAQRFICRSVMQRGKMPFAWLITATQAKTTITDSSANIVKVTSGKFLRDTAELVERVARYLQTYVKVTFDFLACDFIKDEGGLWWLINVKAFKILPEDVPSIHLFVQKGVIDEQKDNISDGNPLKEYTRQKRCEFCHVGFETLSHELTLKMIFEMEEHLRKRGKIVSWLENKEYRHIDEATLYQNYSVCDYCFKLYTETQVLKRIENDLARAFGIPKKSDEAPVQDLELETGIPLRVIKDDPTSHSNFSSLSKFRFLLVLNELQNANFKDNSVYALEYEFLGRNHRVKVPSGRGTVVLSKLRMFYIFSNGRGKFNLFLKRQTLIYVKLMEDGKELSKVKLILSDFKSPFVLVKYYCEHFGDRECPVLTAHIGVVGEPAEKISDLTLRAFHEIYLPPEDYVTCDPLPDEWLNVLPNIFSNLSVSQSMKSITTLQSPSPKAEAQTPSVRVRRVRTARSPSHKLVNSLFQQRFDEINALLKPSDSGPLETLSSTVSPKANFPGYEDFTLTLTIASVTNVDNSEGFEMWRIQWSALHSSKVVERPIEYDLKSAWLSVNAQAKFYIRAMDASLSAYFGSATVDFKLLRVNSSRVGTAKLSLSSLLAEKYVETTVPLVFTPPSAATIAVSVSIVKETELRGKVTKTLYPGVYKLKLTGSSPE